MGTRHSLNAIVRHRISLQESRTSRIVCPHIEGRHDPRDTVVPSAKRPHPPDSPKMPSPIWAGVHVCGALAGSHLCADTAASPLAAADGAGEACRKITSR